MHRRIYSRDTKCISELFPVVGLQYFSNTIWLTENCIISVPSSLGSSSSNETVEKDLHTASTKGLLSVKCESTLPVFVSSPYSVQKKQEPRVRDREKEKEGERARERKIRVFKYKGKRLSFASSTRFILNVIISNEKY